MGSATSKQVVLGYVRKHVEQTKKQSSSMISASVPNSRFQLWLPSRVCDIGYKN